MKRITILLILVTIGLLSFFVLFPKNFGEHTPIWELKERCFGEEYGELRSQYFITLSNSKLWYETNSIFYIWNDHDAFRITEVYLMVKEDIAEDCKIRTSGIIRWEKQSHVRIEASALTEDELSVRVGMHEYRLDETADSINDFETETKMDAEELLDTIAEIRREYRSALQKLSEAEYQKVCSKIYKMIINLVVIWGIYVPFYIYIRMRRKRNNLQI